MEHFCIWCICAYGADKHYISTVLVGFTSLVNIVFLYDQFIYEVFLNQNSKNTMKLKAIITEGDQCLE